MNGTVAQKVLEIDKNFNIVEETNGKHDNRLQELQSLIDVLTTNVGDLMNRIHHISSPVQTQNVRAGMHIHQHEPCH